ncbi:amidase [Streptomyces sp. NPDC004539]|uniref:amidase n=1 Tax=Streptomyces sp. NPDC004539 TaxID=3154280 RepID=UPI0033B4823A
MSAVSVAAAVRSGATTAAEVLEGALERLERVDPILGAFREVWAAEAGVYAREVDARVAAGEALPLAGVPIGVKGRRGARGWRPEVAALIGAGCVPVGGTAVPGAGTAWQTWGLGRHGRTVNPWRHDRTPGGSSAGSAVAVAAGVVPLATGSDGAGSVRIPAAWCGVFGLKLGNGRLPSPDRTGLAAPGFFARHPADAAACWRALSGEPLPLPSRPLDAVWSADLGYADCDPEPVALARAAALRLAESGVVRLTGRAVVLEDPAEAWLALRSPGGVGVGGVREGGVPGAGVREGEAREGRVRGGGVRGGGARGAGVREARAREAGVREAGAREAGVREVNDRRLAEVFRAADLLLTPVTPNAAHGHEGPGERYSTALTWAFNLSGHPAVSVPAGVGADGCPVGLQIVAPPGGEGLLLAVASALPWSLGDPPATPGDPPAVQGNPSAALGDPPVTPW